MTIYLPNFLNPIEARSYFKKSIFPLFPHLPLFEVSSCLSSLNSTRKGEGIGLSYLRKNIHPDNWLPFDVAKLESLSTTTVKMDMLGSMPFLMPWFAWSCGGTSMNKSLLLVDRRSVLSFLSQLGYSSWHCHRSGGFLLFGYNESLPPLTHRRENSSKVFAHLESKCDSLLIQTCWKSVAL